MCSGQVVKHPARRERMWLATRTPRWNSSTVVADTRAAEELAPQRWLPLMSVPHVLKMPLDQVAFDVPYLSADPARSR